MPRWFNIAGPCFAREHYLIPPARRAVEAATLIDQGRWFSLVSGRQTGKTTVVRHLMREINAQGTHRALWVDLETARGIDDPARAFATVFDVFDEVATREGLPAPDASQRSAMLAVPGRCVQRYLSALCAASDRPLVLLLDEADVLTGAAMVSFLTQLRALYLARRQQPAPHAVVLIGVRSVRDYVVNDDRRGVPWLGSASPFNVTVENVTLAAFTEAEVTELCAQHTAETGQGFEPGAVARIHHLSAGHPWLVNALADQCTRRDVTDRTVAIAEVHVEAAKGDRSRTSGRSGDNAPRAANPCQRAPLPPRSATTAPSLRTVPSRGKISTRKPSTGITAVQRSVRPRCTPRRRRRGAPAAV